jgi:hypothetical protein
MFNENDFVTFALSFLEKTLSTKDKPLTIDDIKDRFAEDGGAKRIEELFGERRKAIKSEGYTEATGKFQKIVNKKAKDILGVDTDAETIEDAIAAIKEGYQAPPASDPKELDEKAVKAHPLYLTLEKAKTDSDKALEQRNADFDKALNDKVNGRVTTLTLQQQAQNALTELKAKIPAHPGQKEALMSTYRQQFEGITPKTVDDTTYYYDKDGKRIEDGFGSPLSWDALSRQMAEKVFELEGPDRDSPAAKPGNATPGSGGKAVNLQPKTIDQLNVVLGDNSVKPEDKTAAKDFYKANATDA